VSEQAALREAERVVRVIAETAVANEGYFCELDSAAGDGDFGYSLARGFGQLLDTWDELDYADVSGLLKSCALVISSRVGGTSGPIWGTAFLRASIALGDRPEPSAVDVGEALEAAVAGIKQRGNSDLGDKTLLDALIPAAASFSAEAAAGKPAAEALAAAAQTARAAAEATKGMLALRGRASYTGERSRDSVDAGAIAVAVMFEAVNEGGPE